MWKIKSHKKPKGIKLNNTVFKKLNIHLVKIKYYNSLPWNVDLFLMMDSFKNSWKMSLWFSKLSSPSHIYL